MAEVDCIRCHQRREEIQKMAYGGAIGAALQEKVCNVCWQAWYEQSVKIINEYRLNLREADARTFLSTQMKIFFGMLPPPSEGTLPPLGTPPPP
jgi:Fe-S cluster biosynthesis and repair protein YggX